MKIPFLDRFETRAAYTDAVVQALLQTAGGSTTASVSSLGVVEAAAGLWGRSFASATVTPSNLVTDSLTPAVLEAIGRRLLLHGECLFEIVIEDDGVRLVEASNWDVDSTRRRCGSIKADFSNPDGTHTRALTADRVLHPRINVSSYRPWRGESPIPSATATLAATLETKLLHEVNGPVGSVLPLPHKGSTAQLQQDIDKLSGRTVLVESTAGGSGRPTGSAKDRLGAATHWGESAVVHDWTSQGRTGVYPGGLWMPWEPARAKSDGTLSREEMRRYLHSAPSRLWHVSLPLSCAVKLDTPSLAFDF